LEARVKSFLSELLVRFGNARGDEMTFFATLPAIILSRRPRHSGEDRAHAKSWLGGAPRLGKKPWPRDKDGRSLHFMAQVDLAEIAAAGGSSELPSNGGLAFFIGAGAPHECKVIHIPPGSDSSVTETPDDLPDFEELGGDTHHRGDSLGRRLFPFWPIDFTVVEVPLKGDHCESAVVQHAAIGARFRRREYNCRRAWCSKVRPSRAGGRTRSTM
jgi:hypothetical protein